MAGGVLHAAAGIGEPLGLDPIKDTVDGTVGMNEYAAIFDVLVRYDPSTNRYEPQLAKSVEHNEDFTEWTVRLRPDVVFSDGTPLDAAAVKFNVARWSGPDSIQYYYFVLPEIGAVEAADDLTVVFKLKMPDTQFPYLLTQGLGLVGSPTAIQGSSEADYNLHPVGAGPFMVSKYVPGQSLKLVRNPRYWGGRTHLDGITFTWPNDDSTKRQALERGDLDLAFMMNPPAVARAATAGLGGYLWLRSAASAIQHNGRAGRCTSSQDVRQAVTYAIDHDALNARVYEGKAVATGALFPSGFLKSNVAPLAHDAAKAKSLVARAKATTGWDGTCKLLIFNDPNVRAVALAIQAQLDAVGFKVELDVAPSVSAFTNQIYVNFDYDMALSGIPVTPSGPWAQLFGNISGPLSTFGVDSPAIDTALTHLQQAATRPATTTALDELQRAWNPVQPATVLAAGQYAEIWTDRVHGAVPSSNNTLLLGSAWLAK